MKRFLFLLLLPLLILGCEDRPAPFPVNFKQCRASFNLNGIFSAGAFNTAVISQTTLETNLDLFFNDCPPISSTMVENFPMTFIESTNPPLFVIDLNGILFTGAINNEGGIAALLSESQSGNPACRLSGEIQGGLSGGIFTAQLDIILKHESNTIECEGWL